MWWMVNDRQVTVTHTPTGISAKCDSERSQHRNRMKAMQLLKARMWAAENLERPAPGDLPVASYILPGDITHPDDITEYKKEKQDALSTKSVLHE